MGFCIYYRSSEPMHPALAFEINQHAQRLTSGYTWLSCEPVILDQRPDGFLGGGSKPNFVPDPIDAQSAESSSLPDGTVMTMVEVLCELSRDHPVDWEICHDYEPGPIGRIREGQAETELVEQLETLGTIGDLLDELADEEEADWEMEVTGFGAHVAETDEPNQPESSETDDDDDEPRVLKFPGAE